MAIAEVVLNPVQALGTIRARIREAFVYVQLTILALITGATAVTTEATQLVDALTTIQAGISHTVVNVDVTDAARHSRNAVAGEVVDPVDAGGSVRAGITAALIDIYFAVLSLISWLANALVGIYLVVARGSVEAGKAKAFVHIGITVDSGKSRRTVALVRSLLVLADTIAADLRMQGALVHVVATGASSPSTGALALVVSIR